MQRRLTPDLEESRKLESVRENPAERDHRDDPVPFVHSSVDAVVSDHNVAVDRDHGDAQKGNSDVSVLDEGHKSAEKSFAMHPLALDVPERHER